MKLRGKVNTGKSTTMNAIIGKDKLHTHVNLGETVSVTEVPHAENNNVLFVDTPGLKDMDEKNSAKALKKLKSADVVLYFLNAEGVSIGNEELNTLNKISRRNTNIIVVLNKIDGIE